MALTQLPKEVSLRCGGGPAVWKNKKRKKIVVRGRNPATVVRGRNPAGMSGGGGARGGVGDGGSPPSRPRGLSAILAPSGARKFFDLRTPRFSPIFCQGSPATNRLMRGPQWPAPEIQNCRRAHALPPDMPKTLTTGSTNTLHPLTCLRPISCHSKHGPTPLA